MLTSYPDLFGESASMASALSRTDYLDKPDNDGLLKFPTINALLLNKVAN